MYCILLNLKLYIFFSIVFLFTACDSKEDERNKIIVGKWFIESAEKDGTKIRSLEGTIFEFMPDGKMTTNVPSLGNGNYHFNNDRLIQKGLNAQIYTIEDLTTEKLVLKMQVKDMDFKMTFGRDSSIRIE
jgi:hypothetical protein